MATFQLGLTMAGAISAGAYTAGVFDFLTEALDEWERRKAELRCLGVPPDDWDVPGHDVVIPVISGASAGGITGALGLVALSDAPPEGAADGNSANRPIKHPGMVSRRLTHHEVDGVGTITTGLPRLYDAWVRLPRFVAETSDEACLLGNRDLDGKDLISVLDSSLLDGIVKTSLLGVAAIQPRRRYFADGIHLFLTQSNLTGTPYEVAFSGGGLTPEGYVMLCHADRRHFRVRGLGCAPAASQWADPDPAIEIDVRTLVGLQAVTPPWSIYADAALGTGAFPVGLGARLISPANAADYFDRQWPVADMQYDPTKPGAGFRLRPARQYGDARDRDCSYVAVDGGLINNEPFELARWTLMDRPPEPNERRAELSDRAVLMIDPFPDPPPAEIGKGQDRTLGRVMRRLFPTLQNQVRFKPGDLAGALDEQVYSRFLMSPRRRQAKGAPLEPHPLACGLLGGFGGFVCEAFRAHDYQLGRLNCFLFLRDALAFPEDNRVIAEGYAAGARRKALEAPNPFNGDRRRFFQLIPLTGTAATMPTPPHWPRIDAAAVDRLVERIDERSDRIVAKLRRSARQPVLVDAALATGWSCVTRGKLRDFGRWTLLADLIRRDQLEGASADTNPAEREVLAALADPAYDGRTAAGIAKRQEMSRTDVEAALRKLVASEAACEFNANGTTAYTLPERRRGGITQWFGLRQAREWLWAGRPEIC